MTILSVMVGSAVFCSPKLRRLVAAHEAGHAAVSLVFCVGHQEGVSISLDGHTLGSHTIGDQLDLTVLPRPLALLNASRQAMVSLAGPMAQAKAEGMGFDVAVFLADAGVVGSDAEQVVMAVTVLARHLRIRRADCLLVEDLVEATTEILDRPDVSSLVDAIAQALVRRGRIGGDGLERILVRHPVAHELTKVPAQRLERWRKRS